MKGAKRDKINSNPGLGCPEPQITSHRYIYIEDHPSSTMTDPLHGYTRYLSSPYLSNVHREKERDDSDVAEIRFQKTREISIVPLRSAVPIRGRGLPNCTSTSRTRLIARLL